jgi:hypothetical protein
MVEAGGLLQLRFSHNDDTIWVEAGVYTPPASVAAPTDATTIVRTTVDPLRVGGNTKAFVLTSPPACTCNLHSLCAPTRLGMWHNVRLRLYIESLISAALATGCPVVVASDDILLPLLVASMSKDKATQVTLVSSYFPESTTQIMHQRCLTEFLNASPLARCAAALGAAPVPLTMYTLLEVAEGTAVLDDSAVWIIDPFIGLAHESCLAAGRWSGVS